jgi:hypothetical protein
VNTALLLITSLLVSTIPVSAQEQIANGFDSNRTANQQKIPQTAPPEPQKDLLLTVPSSPANSLSEPAKFGPPEQLSDDVFCYTMRSYVVARDSKHSDSVHPVGYSTCQPASKYRLRTTQMTTGPAQP